MANNPLKENINELQDGDHLLSPTLTNLYEGLHGNGILLTEDTAFADTDRNNPANLGGAMSQGANASKVVVKPFQAILNGVLYDFGGGSNITLDLAVGSSDILDGESIVALTSGQECLFVVIATPLGVKVTQTTRITTAAGAYPSISGSAASYLSDLTSSGSTPPPNGALANQQSTVIGSIRATNSGGTTHGAGIQALSEFNDHRTFIRTSPVYLTTASSNSAGTAGINDHTTLAQIHGSGLHGNFGDAGVLWQSLNSGGETMLYYSRKDSSNRHTHLLGPTNINVSSPGSNQTFTFDSDQVFVLTASTTINLNPSGTFPPGHAVFVSVPSGSTVTFDSTGLNTAVAAGDAVMFAYDGSNWKKVLYSSTVATTSSGASGRVQLSDGAGGFTSDAALFFTAGTPDTLTVDGKLNVTGLIDPTGLVIDEKANVAATGHTTAAGKGLLWVKNDAPNRLYFTDDAGTDKKVIHATDSVTELSDVSNAGSGAIITAGERTTVSGASGANGILKSNGSGTVSAAVANTDYQKVLAEGGFVDGDKTKLDGIASGATASAGTVTSIATSAPITGGTITGTGTIGISAATTSAAGSMSSADKTKLDGIEANADVTDATNVNAAGAIMNSDVATKGQIIVGDGSGDPTILSVGTNGHVLTADSAEASGVKWAAASGGSSYSDANAIAAVEGESTLALTGDVGIGGTETGTRFYVEETTDNFPVRIRGLEGNIRTNKFAHIQIQNDNSSPPSSAAFDDPVWQIGQRDGGQFDIAFGNISTQLVPGSKAILSLSRATVTDETSAPQIGFFGTTAAAKTAVAALGALTNTGVLGTQAVAPESPPQPAADLASTQGAIDNLQLKLDAFITQQATNNNNLQVKLDALIASLSNLGLV